MVGSLLSGPLMVYIGQRVVLLISLPIVLIMWLGIAFAPNIIILQISRAALGISLGLMGGTANNFVVEIAHVGIRGNLTSLVDIFRQTGYLYVFIVGSTQLNWRQVAIVCGITTTIIPFIGLFLVHSSPRWLATQGKLDEARKSLLFYRGNVIEVDSELNDITTQLKRSSNKGNSVSAQFQLMFHKDNRKRIVIASVLMFAAFFTAYNLITTYAVVIFSGFTKGINPYFSTIIIGLMRVIGTIIYSLISEKFERKRLFLIPLSISGCSLGFLAIFLYLKALKYPLESFDWVPLVLLIIFTLTNCMAFPVLILYRSELLPNSVRALSSGLVYVLFFFGNFITLFSYPYLVDWIGTHGTFGLYSLFTFLIVLFGYFTLPETRGRTLEEIEEDFKGKKK